MRFNSTYRRWRSAALAMGLTVALSGCDSLLEVSNPNDISGDDVLLPTAASGLVNGVENLLNGGFSEIMASIATITDELDWVGSRDSYNEHDKGNLADPFNEFTDEQYKTLAQSTWLADETVNILTEQQSAGELLDVQELARAHVYRAVIYMYVADFFDDFPVGSDRREGGSPAGEGGMGQFYAGAKTSLNTAIGIATGDLKVLAQALLARAEHAEAIWNEIGTRPVTKPARFAESGLVSGGATSAATALAAAGGLSADWVVYHNYSVSTVGNSLAGWVNSRQEMKLGPTYATPEASGKPTFEEYSIEDPIDGIVSPIFTEVADEFTSDLNYPPMRLISSRELQLIIAEAELPGDPAGFLTAINALRAVDGLTDYDGATQDIDGNGTPGQMSDHVAMLVHMRQTTLFLHGRRLADHYRFGDPSPEWLSTSTANNNWATFLPIPANECQANPNVGGAC